MAALTFPLKKRDAGKVTFVPDCSWFSFRSFELLMYHNLRALPPDNYHEFQKEEKQALLMLPSVPSTKQRTRDSTPARDSRIMSNTFYAGSIILE